MLRLLLAAFLCLAATLHAADRNIVFYIADDMGTELGCYGNTIIKTPHIDALAADSTVFTNAYATTASCSASRSVIMTGLHNHASGQYGHQHDTGHFSCYPNTISLALPQVMRRAGYRTALIGKHHVGPAQIFDFDIIRPAIGKGRNSVQTIESARDIIFSGDPKPFLLYIGLSDPHRDSHFLDLPHRPNAFGNLPAKKTYPDVEETFYHPDEVTVPAFLPDTPECRAELTQYYQSVSRVDAGLGRLVALLKEAGLYDHTLIIVTSDHGMAFPGGKTTVYEPGLRVPLVVRDPHTARRGIRNAALVSHADITPTLLDYAGGLDHQANAPKNLLDAKACRDQQGLSKLDNLGPPFTHYHGRSWLGIIGQDDDPSRNVVFASHTFHEVQMYYPMRVIRDRNFKLIWNIANPLPYPFASDLWQAPTWQAQLKKGNDASYGTRTVGRYLHRPAFELYDIRYDPDETHNLAGNPAYAETLAAYKNKLREFQEQTRDPWALKWQYE